LQAGIAACHCVAKDYASTDWRKILSLYDQLVELDHSPVIALNRAIVIANLDGPQAGLEAIAAIRDLEVLNTYYLFHAVLGEFESQLNRSQVAAGHFRKSLDLAETLSEEVFLSKRLRACEKTVTSDQ
jgi:RNA polymerase sigma-70 factor (ECF subfamily)